MSSVDVFFIKINNFKPLTKHSFRGTIKVSNYLDPEFVFSGSNLFVKVISRQHHKTKRLVPCIGISAEDRKCLIKWGFIFTLKTK